MLIRYEGIRAGPYGKRPKDRSMEELLKASIVIIDKPPGPTSHQVSAWVKSILGADNTGHSGTLDPHVTGVLPVAIDRATKALDVLLPYGKEYVGVMRFHSYVERKDVKGIFREFTGKIYQTPPVRAAVKRVMRTKEIYRLELLEMKGNYVLFRAVVESGTYIRTLCHDIGDALGVGANMLELRRTRSAHFTENEAVTLHELKDAYEYMKEGDDSALRKILLPIERIFDRVPKIVVKDSTVGALCHGAELSVKGIVSVDEGIKKGDTAAVFTLKGEVVESALAEMSSMEMVKRSEGIAARPIRVYMERGIYPKVWKKRSSVESD